MAELLRAELADAELLVELHSKTLGAVKSALGGHAPELPASCAPLVSKGHDPRLAIVVSQAIVLVLATALGRVLMLA